MAILDINRKLIQSYLELLGNLSPESQLELIEKLSKALKSNIKEVENSDHSLFGAFESEQTADQIIAELRSSRNVKRQIESF